MPLRWDFIKNADGVQPHHLWGVTILFLPYGLVQHDYHVTVLQKKTFVCHSLSTLLMRLPFAFRWN